MTATSVQSEARPIRPHISYYFFPFAIGNLLGPLLLGHLLDTSAAAR